jgi:hypothetical protein
MRLWDRLDKFSDRLFSRDDMTEIERAIAHNEARGDPIPQEWYDARARGVQRFEELNPDS